MNTIRVKDLICITGGNTKVVICNTANNCCKEVWRGKVDDINFDNIPYGKNEIEHTTVVEDEDVLQIHLWEDIVKTDGVCSGDWRIEGTRITVKQIQDLFNKGESIEDIQWLFDQLTRESIENALKFELNCI